MEADFSKDLTGRFMREKKFENFRFSPCANRQLVFFFSTVITVARFVTRAAWF
jgi:hypothetical protein